MNRCSWSDVLRDNAFTVFQKSERVPQFWVLQLVGWGTYALIIALGVAPHLRRHGFVAFEVTFVLMTFLSSFVLRRQCRRLWRRNVPWSNAMLQSVLACGFLAIPCAIAAQVADLIAGAVPITWHSLAVAFE